jgi:hypothetical protein
MQSDLDPTYSLPDLRDRLCILLVRRMPKRLIYWAGVRLLELMYRRYGSTARDMTIEDGLGVLGR